MSQNDPARVIIGLYAIAILVTVLAQPLDPITDMNLAMLSRLLWGLAILGTIAMLFATVNGLAAGGGR